MSTQSTPIKGRNAIESASFFLVLNQPVDPATTERLKQALEQFRGELPGVAPQQLGFVINFVGGLPQPVAQAGGGALTRFASAIDGTHTWRVEANGNVIQVTCGDYTDFQEVWARAEGYLKALASVVSPDIGVAEVGFQIVDKFTYPSNLAEDSYRVDELFRADSPFLTGNARESGLLWHVFQGWFESVGGAKMLHQVNIANTNATGVDQQFAAVIDHRIVVRWMTSPAPALSELLGPDSEEARSLAGLMRRMHSRNVAVMKQILTDQKQHDIGLIGR